MKTRKLQLLATALSCVGMLTSPLSLAAAPSAAPRDVVLHEGGVLLGQVVDAQGGALMNTPVVVTSGTQEVARVQTDRTGRFSVNGLKGGAYGVASAGQQGVYRLWAPQTAPPTAQQGLMLVTGNSFVRGQDCCGVVGCGNACGAGTPQGPLRRAASWMAAHPIITAGAIAAAIAIPLAVNDDNPATP